MLIGLVNAKSLSLKPVPDNVTIKGAPGENVIIPIILDYEGAEVNIPTIGIYIDFDLNILENPRVSIGSAARTAEKQIGGNLDPEDLYYKIIIYDLGLNQNEIQGGIVGFVSFSIKEDALYGDTELTIVNDEELATDENGNIVSITPLDGKINVRGDTSEFPDVLEDSWAKVYINSIFYAGLTTGYPDGTYGPENLVTRAEMAAFLVRAKIGDDFIYKETPYFSDVSDPTYWAFKYIQKLKELGITTGYPDGTYGPENLVTRAEMAAFLGRAFLELE